VNIAGPWVAPAQASNHMRAAVAAGLPIAFGTDAGVIPHGANAREFDYLAAIGLDAPSAPVWLIYEFGPVPKGP
jgi:imidazolonepropionase-like amidohydrolase